MRRENGKHQPPTLYDISGSANWANKADVGLVVFREETVPNTAGIRIRKLRFKIGRQNRCRAIALRPRYGTGFRFGRNGGRGVSNSVDPWKPSPWR
jgi:hypothetical protein